MATRRSERTSPSSAGGNNTENGEILIGKDIKRAKKMTLKYLHQTLDHESGMLQVNVCVVCDCFILGTQNVKWLDKIQLKVHDD